MESHKVASQLSGIYVPLPTFFVDPALEVNIAAMRRHVRFLIDAGIRTGNGVLLAGGGAGEFSALSTNERLTDRRSGDCRFQRGKIGVVVGVQHTNWREVITLCREARRMGVVAVQISPPAGENPHGR